MDYKKIIKMILIDKNMKQADIADKTGQDRRTVSRTLNDTSVTNVNTLIDMLDALGCELYIRDGKKEYKLDKVKDK